MSKSKKILNEICSALDYIRIPSAGTIKQSVLEYGEMRAREEIAKFARGIGLEGEEVVILPTMAGELLKMKGKQILLGYGGRSSTCTLVDVGCDFIKVSFGTGSPKRLIALRNVDDVQLA